MVNNKIEEVRMYQVVLLEDDPSDLNLIRENLENRGIKVHAFVDGYQAINKISDDTSISALVTDVVIRYPFPHGPRNGPQGYDVANRFATDHPHRPLALVVLTSQNEERTFDTVRLFKQRFEPFHKMKWQKLSAKEDIDLTFEALAQLVKDSIDRTKK